MNLVASLLVGGVKTLEKTSRNLDWLRGNRVTLGQLNPGLGFSTTIFLGLYQGKEYFPDRLREIEQQTNQNFYLIVADNFSSDFDLEQTAHLLSKSKISKDRYLIVQNPVNLGGLGSFQLNLDLVLSPWITTLHQDDQYLPNHLETHLKSIDESVPEVVSMSTDLGSLGSDGRRIPVPPRANWFIQGKSQEDQFIAIVGEQVIPFPALSIRTSQVDPDLVPWHTAAFSDSEQTLLSLTSGKHKFIEKETVLYRENPNSESHTQGEIVRIHSATLGLLRVFSSERFIDFALGISEENRGNFAMALQSAISKRLPKAEYRDLVWSMCLEQLTHAWVYQEAVTTAKTIELFTDLGQSYTPEILKGILGSANPSVRLDSYTAKPDSNKVKTNEKPDPEINRALSGRPKFRFLTALFQVVGRMPYFARRRIFKIYHWLKQNLGKSS
jgi:glycosyltransferase involved in cell wall biosynthesis